MNSSNKVRVAFTVSSNWIRVLFMFGFLSANLNGFSQASVSISGSSGPFCPGETRSFTANLSDCSNPEWDYSGSWNFVEGTSDTDRQIRVQFGSEGQLSLEGNCGITAAKNITLTDGNANVSISSSSGTINLGESVTLTASGADTYQWSGSGLSSTRGRTVTATPRSSGNITYSVTGSSSCDDDSESITITVIGPLPDAGTITLDLTPGCTTVTGTVRSNPVEGTVKFWERSYNAGNSFLPIVNTVGQNDYVFTESQAAEFRVVVESAGHPDDRSNIRSVQLLDEPSGTANKTSETINCADASAALSIQDMVGNFNYWQSSADNVNWGRANEISNNTSTAVSVSTNVLRYYRGFISNECGSIFTDPVSLQPDNPIAGFISIDFDVNDCSVARGTLNLEGAVGDQITWYANGTPFGGSSLSQSFDITSRTVFSATVSRSAAPQCGTVSTEEEEILVSSFGGSETLTSMVEGCNSVTTNLSLSTDRVGQVVRWERSSDQTDWSTIVDNSAGVINQFETTATQPINYYRAFVELNGCPGVYSPDVLVEVSTPAIPGGVKFVEEWQSATFEGSLTLYPRFQLQNAQNGIITQWLLETASGTTTVPSNGTNSINLTITETTEVRAEVVSGACDPLLSAESIFVINTSSTGTEELFDGRTLDDYQGSNYLLQTADGLSITGGFRFFANSGQSFFVLQGDRYSVPSKDHSYVLDETLVVEGVTEELDVHFVGPDGRISGYNYVDGLGRPDQQVDWKASPMLKDVVIPIAYDFYNRQEEEFLPYVADEDNADFQLEAVDDQKAFYLNPSEKVVSTDDPIAKKVFEASPLNRVLTQGFVGTSWQPETGHPARFGWESNQLNDIILWQVNGDAVFPVRAGHYEPAALWVRRTIDENGVISKTFEDQNELLIAKRIQDGEGGWLETSYIYDDFNRLRFTIQPEGVKQLPENPDASFFDRWAFQYEYDFRGRLIAKRVPGADWMYLVYDNLDRLVLSQDGNQRVDEKWLFTKYDHLNRPVITGFYASSDDRAALQSVVDGFYTGFPDTSPRWYEERDTDEVTLLYSNRTFPTTDLEYLTASYFDDYSWKDLVTGIDLDYKADELLADARGPGQELAHFELVKGLTTGSRVRTLVDGGGSWLWGVSYYDDEYRPIQSGTQNHVGGVDHRTTVYNFRDEVLKTRTSHQTTSNSWSIVERFLYDHRSRLIQQTHQVNDEPEETVARFEYNELGQLVDKKLHEVESGQPIQSVDFRYNVRGWLSHINNEDLVLDGGITNDDDSFEPDAFGMKLTYDNPGSIGATPQYNGNISGMNWQSNGNGRQSNAYAYDPLDRLTGATHSASGSNFSVGGITYDGNGNLMTLNRNFDGSPADELQYTYTGNQLASVTDATSDALLFTDGNTTGDDYIHDENGNMIEDKNKGIASIDYNHLNLPKRVNFDADNYITYLYDAAGIKLSQTVVEDGNAVKTTDYVGEFIYEDFHDGNGSQLQLIQHAEGRLTPLPGGVGGGFDYQYYLKDHLGNTRVTLSTTPENYSMTETFESGEDNGFEDLHRFTSISGNTTAGGDEVELLQSGQTGAMIFLDMNKGDTINLSVNTNYEVAPTGNSFMGTVFGTIFSSFDNIYGSGAGDGGVVGSNSNAFDEALSGANMTGKGSAGTAPRAFLNYIFFDKEMNYVTAGFVQVTTAALGVGSREEIGINDIIAGQEGYLLAYISNENTEAVNMHFDDFTIYHGKTNVVQTDDYYPFGLTFNSYSRTASTVNNFKYNSFEYTADLGLNLYDYQARYYDPAIGRFINVDPAAELMRRHSPYNYAYDNPIRFIDPDGMVPEEVGKSPCGDKPCPEEQSTETEQKPEETEPDQEVKKPDFGGTFTITEAFNYFVDYLKNSENIEGDGETVEDGTVQWTDGDGGGGSKTESNNTPDNCVNCAPIAIKGAKSKNLYERGKDIAAGLASWIDGWVSASGNAESSSTSYENVEYFENAYKITWGDPNDPDSTLTQSRDLTIRPKRTRRGGN